MQITGLQSSQFVGGSTYQKDLHFLKEQISKLKKELEGNTDNYGMAQTLEFDKKVLTNLHSNPGVSLGNAYVATVVIETKDNYPFLLLEIHEPQKAMQYLQAVKEKAQEISQNPEQLKSAFEYQVHLPPNYL